MSPEIFRAFARYNRWMNEKIYLTAAELTDDERKKDRGAFFKSIHATLNHILVVDRVWMGRLGGVHLEEGEMGPGGIRSLDQELLSNFEELRTERAKTDAAIDAWARSLNEEQSASLFSFVRNGAKSEIPVWWAATQLFNHQTHHRGQVTTLLVQAGKDPGVTDLMAMLRSETS